MQVRYDDILTRIPEPPLWWLHGVPRYEPFSVKLMPIGPKEMALVRSACSMCGTIFDVGAYRPYGNYHSTLKAEIEHYGYICLEDPPAVFCCPAGYATTSSALEVLEFWKRDGRDWRRVPELERRFPDS
jgi:hypothetical protein